MKIGLIDIDNKIANLPLMKIKSYYKDKCNWFDGFSKYNKVYISKIFNFSKDYAFHINSNEIIKGGTGFDIKLKLPENIERYQPDYSLYPNCDYSLQRYTIGCIRNCPFCIVREKEGCLEDVSPMNLNPKGKWIYLLDNNFFASDNWKGNIKHLQNYNQKVQFEGIDIRILTEEMMIELNKIKQYKKYHFAWDNAKEDILSKLKLITKIIKPYKLMCYVLIGFNSIHEENYYRVMKLKEFGITPFVMCYNKKDDYQKKFSIWVNRTWIFKSCDWKDFKYLPFIRNRKYLINMDKNNLNINFKEKV